MIRLLCLFFCVCLFIFSLPSSAADDDDIATGPPIPLAPPPGLNKAPFKPSVAVIVGVLTVIFSITFLILLYVKHCKTTNIDYPNNSRGGGIAPSSDRKNSGIDHNVIDLLPVFRFGSLRGQKDGLECAVCLNKFESSEVLRLLPKCKHAFHVECVDTWLDAHSTCPLCRCRVDPEDILLIDDYKHEDHHHSQQVQQQEVVQEIHRISGRHSSAGERGSSASKSLQVIVENPPNESLLSTLQLRRSLDSSMKFKKEVTSVSIGCFDRPRKDELLLAGKEYSRKGSDRRLEHRIVVSSGGETDERWSDVQPSDLLYLRSEMLINDSRRVSASSSRPSVASPSGQRQREGGGIDEERERQQQQQKKKTRRENDRSVINGRSVSEITGISRMSSNDEQQRRKQLRQRQEEGFVSRWLAWISDTNKYHHQTSNPPPPPPRLPVPPPPPPPPPPPRRPWPAVSQSGQPSSFPG